jgi:hypothetical protein
VKPGQDLASGVGGGWHEDKRYQERWGWPSDVTANHSPAALAAAEHRLWTQLPGSCASEPAART